MENVSIVSSIFVMNVILKKTMAKQSALNVVIMHIMIPKENAKNVEGLV